MRALRPRLHGGGMSVVGCGPSAQRAQETHRRIGTDPGERRRLHGALRGRPARGSHLPGPGCARHVSEGRRRRTPAELVGSLGGPPVERLHCPTDVPFFASQQKIVLENSGVIDPEDIDQYIAADGYRALVTALTEMTPAEVLREVDASGLRGRGGGGYPAGLKWSTVAKMPGNEKFVVCNADEGDPGAFMDRAVLESDPHRVLEGMVLAGYAVGASHGFVYVRAEYPLAIERLTTAIRQATKKELLGQNICETRFSFDIELRLGAGAFVCGEETALMASIEGKRGQPRPRPPYPAQSGLWGYPTLINNVETLANIPPIIRRGGAWFASIGTEKSKGTKVFALAGRIRNTGLIEVPMGITLRDIVFTIGGGVPEGSRFKAVQTGGPSGGCLARTVPRFARRLRHAPPGRFDHGLGRHDRHGPHVVDGRCGPLLHGILHGRVVRQVRPLPSRHAPDARTAGQDRQGEGDRQRPGAAGRNVRGREGHEPVRPGTDRAQPGAQHAPPFPRRVFDETSGPRTSGWRRGRVLRLSEPTEAAS